MGPFPPLTVPSDSDADLTCSRAIRSAASGQVIETTGRVLDQKGNPIPGARLDLWQANAADRYDHPDRHRHGAARPDFQGFASIVSDSNGNWRIVTIKPGG